MHLLGLAGKCTWAKSYRGNRSLGLSNA